MSTKRIAVAYPTESQPTHFASGVNHPGEVRGLALSGRSVGITASECYDGLAGALIAELANYAGGGLLEVFVDSGAFGEMEFTAAGPRVKREITTADWAKRFEIFRWVACAFGHRALLVAPDRVGCQETTISRLRSYAAEVATWRSVGARVMVPVQKGAMPMSAFYRLACDTLGFDAIAGVPMKKDATSLDDLRELVESMPWFCTIHLLGLGPSSKRYAPAVALIKSLRPAAVVTSDSVTVRSMVGRTNGRGGGPRELTKRHDDAKALGIRDAFGGKSYALTLQGWAELARDRRAAIVGGWFDVELFDSAAEALADHDATYDADGNRLETLEMVGAA